MDTSIKTLITFSVLMFSCLVLTQVFCYNIQKKSAYNVLLESIDMIDEYGYTATTEKKLEKLTAKFNISILVEDLSELDFIKYKITVSFNINILSKVKTIKLKGYTRLLKNNY